MFSLPIMSALKAAASLRRPDSGCQIHSLAIKIGQLRDCHVGCGVFDMYSKLGDCSDARKTFDEMPERNGVIWNAYISNSVLAARPWDAIWGFIQFRHSGVSAGPDYITICSFLNACSDVCSSKLGEQMHGYAICSGNDWDVSEANALIDFYGKCDRFGCSEKVFIGIHKPNSVSFSSIVAAYEQNSEWEEGMGILESMRMFGVSQGVEHYACVVDMLGRAGMVERAYGFILNLPMAPTISMWGALFGACRVHRKPELGKIAAQKLFKIDYEDSGNHVLLSNTFAADGRWEEATDVRTEMNDVGGKKGVGSRIAVYRRKMESALSNPRKLAVAIRGFTMRINLLASL